jgi:DNA polymerase-3 subunit alpha
MSGWVPIHVHSDASLLDGLSKPKQIIERCKELGYHATAITDHGVLTSVPAILAGAEKAKMKGIAGCEFYLCQQDATIRTKENGKLSHLCVLAKSLKGWKNLMRASSASFRPEHSYRKQRLDLDKLASFSEGEFICFSGHLGSDMANICFDEPRLAYTAKTYDEARGMVSAAWRERVLGMAQRYRTLFGKENFFLEIQVVDQVQLPAALVVARILRWASKELGIDRVATADSHYCRQEDAADQRVLLCASMETTMREVTRKLDAAEEVGLGAFFRSNNYHIPSYDEMEKLHHEFPEELENTVKIADRCESYKIGGKPMLPTYECSEGRTPDEHLKALCQSGWDRKIAGKVPAEKLQEYHDRLWETEIPILTGAGLSSYFLIVQNYIRYAIETLKSKVGLGRGSGAGSLVSYLLDITHLDPIEFGLLFARFYSDGRNVPYHVSFDESPFSKFK